MKECDFSNTEEEWNAFMDRHGGTGARIVLEASTSGKYAARLLRGRGFDVHMANPRKMRAIYESYKKTDRNDARILAKKLREGELPESLPAAEGDGRHPVPGALQEIPGGGDHRYQEPRPCRPCTVRHND
ncbi:MAG: transposase [Candidatus Thermoplasmatota archaeon]|nr:transposase [Candidatus Thermoplasmatota archaeon]